MREVGEMEHIDLVEAMRSSHLRWWVNAVGRRDWSGVLVATAFSKLQRMHLPQFQTVPHPQDLLVGVQNRKSDRHSIIDA